MAGAKYSAEFRAAEVGTGRVSLVGLGSWAAETLATPTKLNAAVWGWALLHLPNASLPVEVDHNKLQFVLEWGSSAVTAYNNEDRPEGAEELRCVRRCFNPTHLLAVVLCAARTVRAKLSLAYEPMCFLRSDSCSVLRTARSTMDPLFTEVMLPALH